MLFKKEEKDLSECSIEELEKIAEKKLKRYERIRRLKKVLLTTIVIIGLIGGYKSFLNNGESSRYEDAENQTFVKSYAQNYYAYPKSNEVKEYIDSFTLEPSSWTYEYAQGMESVKIGNLQIYKVKTTDQPLKVQTYYLYGDLESKKKDQDAVSTRIYFDVSIAKDDSGYKVVKPMEHRSIAINEIKDKEQLEQYKFEPETGKTQCTDSEKKDIENTIKLFFATFKENHEQAELLVTDKAIIDQLDPNTTITMTSLHSATQDEETQFITVAVKENVGDILTQNKNYYFEINKSKNKIQNMEVY